MKIEIYSDGSCLGNPGPGGWANIVRYPQYEDKFQGGEVHSTNNRMEMTAVIEGLKEVKKTLKEEGVVHPLKIEFYTDSSLIVNTMTKGWKKKKNKDLWQELDDLIAGPILNDAKLEWNWVKGHAGHAENEDCDTRANIESAAFAEHAKRIPASEKKLPGEAPSLF